MSPPAWPGCSIDCFLHTKKKKYCYLNMETINSCIVCSLPILPEIWTRILEFNKTTTSQLAALVTGLCQCGNLRENISFRKLAANTKTSSEEFRMDIRQALAKAISLSTDGGFAQLALSVLNEIIEVDDEQQVERRIHKFEIILLRQKLQVAQDAADKSAQEAVKSAQEAVKSAQRIVHLEIKIAAYEAELTLLRPLACIVIASVGRKSTEFFNESLEGRIHESWNYNRARQRSERAPNEFKKFTLTRSYLSHT